MIAPGGSFWNILRGCPIRIYHRSSSVPQLSQIPVWKGHLSTDFCCRPFVTHPIRHGFPQRRRSPSRGAVNKKGGRATGSVVPGRYQRKSPAVPGAYLVSFPHTLNLPEVTLKSRSWAARVAIFSGGILAVAVLFLVVVRSLDMTVAGVEPEALVLTAMMTAPITLGGFLLLVLGAAAAERVVRRVRA